MGQRFLHRRCRVFDFFTKLHIAFCELPKCFFFPGVIDNYFCRLPLFHPAAAAADVLLKAGTLYV